MSQEHPDAAALRRRAEALLARVPGEFLPENIKSLQEMTQELEVYQTELELQNETLREAQAALHEARDRFAALYEYAPVGYVVLDGSGIIRQANATWRAMLGREDDELRGRPFADTLADGDADVFRARFRAFFRNPAEKQIVVRMQRRDGSEFHARLEARPRDVPTLPAGAGGADRDELLVNVSDVSELFRAQQQVEDQNRELQRVNDRAERLNALLWAIRNVNQLITKEEDRDRLIQGACENLTGTLSYHSAWIAVLDEAGQTAVAMAQAGFGEAFGALAAALRAGRFPACMQQALAGDAVVTILDMASECIACDLARPSREVAGMVRRLGFGGTVYGVLVVSVPAAYAVNDEETGLFDEVAGDIAFALHKIELDRRLREARRRHREIFEGSRDGFVMTDGEGRILDANQAYCEMLGYTLSELRGLKDFYAITPARWHVWETQEIWHGRLLPQGRSGLYEKEYIRKDGTVFPIELQCYLVRDARGVIEYVWGAVRDISERKRHEERISLLGRMLDEAPAAVMIHDAEGQIRYANHQAVRMHGYDDEAEFLAVNLNALDVPESAALIEERVRDIAVRGEAQFEVTHYRKDRSLLPMDVLVKVIDWHGRPAMLSIARDVSERKRSEEVQERLREHLAQAQKLESVGRLAGGVAHDFNNMLGVILGHADLALEGVAPGSSLGASLEEIRKAAERSAKLTRQLLAFARKQTISPRLLDLNETIESMLKMLRRLIGEDIDLCWLPAERIKPVRMDPAQIDQLLANLVVNARDAIAGVGQVTIETGLVRFDEAYCAVHDGYVPGEYVLLAVSDTGCGMDQATMSQIFEPFFTTKEVGVGTGLGLATVYGIIKQNGGLINVYSEVGEGSTFRIYLPAQAAVAASAVSPAPVAPPTARGEETVLLVEDEPPILALCSKMLERLGYRVLVASSPSEALSLAAAFPGDVQLLITDVVMPEMNGRDLANRLLVRFPDMKLLFISGYTANAIAHRGVLDEGLRFLAKPFSLADLAHKVREALDCPG